MTTQAGRPRILLVDGSHDDRQVFRRAMEAEGMDCLVVECDKAGMALTYAQEGDRPFDLVAGELDLPDMSGLDLFRSMKNMGRCPAFVLLVRRASFPIVEKALREGVSDYLVKDSDIYREALPLVVRHALERSLTEALREEARKRLEEALRQNEEQFTLFTSRFPGMVYLRDGQGRFIYLNQYLEKVYGLSKDAFIGRSARDIWPGGTGLAIEEDDAQVLATGADSRRIEDLSLGGRTVSFFTQKFAMPLAGGSKVLGGISLDVTDYRRTGQRNHLLASAIEHAAEGVFILDGSGVIQYANPAAELSLGVTRFDLAGRHYGQLLEVPSGQGEAPAFGKMQGKPWKGTVERMSSDDTKRELNVTIAPAGDPAINHTVIEHDVTEEKALQRALERKRKLEALGMLAGGIAHDFINILQPILINAELVRDVLPGDAPEKELLGQIIEAARVGKDLTNQIKVFGSVKNKLLKTVAIVPVVRDSLRMVRQSLPAGVKLVARVRPTAARVRIDPPQFYQLLANLCTNAVQSMEGMPGSLSVALAEVTVSSPTPACVSILGPGEYVKLSVTDTGCGMSPEVLDQIFDPFFTTRKPGKGTGLGLGVVHAAAKNAGGSIIVSSAPGKGTIFEVFFPRHAAAADEPVRGEGHCMGQDSGGTRYARKKSSVRKSHGRT